MTISKASLRDALLVEIAKGTAQLLDEGQFISCEMQKRRADLLKVLKVFEEVTTCPRCESKNCECFVESDALWSDGANVICKECGMLFNVKE